MPIYTFEIPTNLADGFSKFSCDAGTLCDGFPQPWYNAFEPSLTRPTPTSWNLYIQIRPWLFVLLGLIYPLYVFAVLPFVIRGRRKRKGLCIHCAYDLTGNTSGVCPECGKGVNSVVETKS